MDVVQAIIRRSLTWTGSIAGFVRHLNRQGLAHLSYSKVTSVEFCRQRHLLEWVERRRLLPKPIYLCALLSPGG